MCLLVALAGCTDLADTKSATPDGVTPTGAGGNTGGCVDKDNDGFGDGCTAGKDCNDNDPRITTQCMGGCSSPAEGCACTATAPAVPCFLDQTTAASGQIMCHEGKRSCREGTWSACEDVHTYALPVRQDTRLLPDVYPRRTCSDCEQNCFVAEDPLSYVDGGVGGYGSSNLEQIPSGGLTIFTDASLITYDAGIGMYPDGAVSEWPVAYPDGGCEPGDPLDSDCDGVPNYYDRQPGIRTVPFDHPNPIVRTTDSNEQVDVVIGDFEFRLTQADVFFAMEMAGAQAAERTAFIKAIRNEFGGANSPMDLVTPVAGAAYNCQDSDGDGDSINEDTLYKVGGVLGAARCYLGDVRFGLGHFDEVPVMDSCTFSYGGVTLLGVTYGATTTYECHYGPHNSIPFRPLLDVTDNDAVIRDAVYRLPMPLTRLEVPQSGTQALWALAAGNSGDLYYGPQRPAFGTRRDCASGGWGGACFRNGVVPISFMFTGTGQHNGPTNYIPTGYRPRLNTSTSPTSEGAPYYATNLALPASNAWGTPHAGGWRAQHLPKTGETMFSPSSLGAIDNQRKTFTGSTIDMAANVGAATFGMCGMTVEAAAPDAFMTFSVANNGTPVRLRLTETNIDSNGDSGQVPATYPKVLAVFPNLGAPATTIGMNYDTGPAPLNNRIVRLDGNTNPLLPGGISGASTCGSDDTTGQSFITFTTTGVATEIIGELTGAGPQAVMDLYEGPPPTPPAPLVLWSPNPPALDVRNANDTFATAYDINATSSPASPGFQSFAGNTSNTLGQHPVDYRTDLMAGCGATSHTANDAVYRFHLDTASRVRIDTAGSLIDTVISLHSAPPVADVDVTVDNAQADTLAGYHIGDANGSVIYATGDLTGATNNLVIGGTSCLGAGAAPDHVLPFTVSTAGPPALRVENQGGTAAAPIAVYLNSLPTGQLAVTTAGGETAATPNDLGIYSGGPLSFDGAAVTTAGRVADYTADMFGTCASPPVDGGYDVVYRFTTGATPVSIASLQVDDLTYGGARPIVALYQTTPPMLYETVMGNDVVGNARVVDIPSGGGPFLFTGTTTGYGTGFGPGAPNTYSNFGISSTGGTCGMNTTGSARDALFRINNQVDQNVSFRMTTVTSQNPVIRLFPSRGLGNPATPWVKDEQSYNAADTFSRFGTVANANNNVIDVNGRTVRISGNFNNGSFNRTANFGCVNNTDSRNAYFRIRLTSPTTLWLNAHGDDEIAMGVFPSTTATFNAANLSPGFGACLGSGNDISRTVTLAAGEYFVVIKNRYRHGVLGSLLQSEQRNNKAFYFEAYDATSQTALPVGGLAQAQLTCAQGGSSPSTASFNYAGLPAGSYHLQTTSQQDTIGTYRMVIGANTTMPAPNRCSDAAAPVIDTTVALTPANANGPNGYNFGDITNRWVRGTGNFDNGAWTDTADMCGVHQNSRNAVVTFTLTEHRRVQLRAYGDADSPVVASIFNSAGAIVSANRVTNVGGFTAACDAGADGVTQTVELDLDPGTYRAVVKANRVGCEVGIFGGCCGGLNLCTGSWNNWYQDDPFWLELRDVTQTMNNVNLAANTTYYVVVKNRAAAVGGRYSITAGSTQPPAACLAPGNSALVNFPVGTHYAVAQGGAGEYTFRVGPTGAGLTNIVACDNDSGAGTSSLITEDLPAGDYWVVVKGRTSTDNGPYRLNIRDLDNTSNNYINCAAASGTTSFTETLPAGTYTAVISGSNGEGGPFEALLYDTAAIQPAMFCSNTGDLSLTLDAGDHLVGIKGSAPGARNAGAYQLTVEGGATIPTANTAARAFNSKTWGVARSAVSGSGMKVVPMQSCEPGIDWGTGTGSPNDDGSGTGTPPQEYCGHTYTGPLAFLVNIIAFAGQLLIDLGNAIPIVGFLLVILGLIVCALAFLLATLLSGAGLVQIDATTPAIIANPASCEYTAGGSSTPEQDADALMATVQSPANYTPARGMWPQSKSIASDTGSVDTAGDPLAYWLRASPSDEFMGLQISRALYRISESAQMDVSIRLVWDSSTIPGYQVSLSATSPTDCASVAGVTHRDCRPGDNPQFSVSFTNPGGNPVLENPDPGWNGAWPGRLQILGDGNFVLEEIPVLLIPPIPAVMPPVQPMRYSMPATYYQDIGTRECDGNNLPDWSNLYWNAELPPDTSIDFYACTAPTVADLDTACMTNRVLVATVTGTNIPCTGDDQCRPFNGYCGSGGPDYPGTYCQRITPQKTEGICTSSFECPNGTDNGINGYMLWSDCNNGTCEFDSMPASISNAIGTDNFRRAGRIDISLNPNLPAGTHAPILRDWAATYICTPSQ